MLTLNDGRSELWQWDTGRTLSVDADCSQVHFSNKVFGRSIDVDVVDGAAIIPDVLLQTDKELNVWAFAGTAENGYTKISKTFKVNRRNKPADYVFTPTDQITLQTIQSQIGDLDGLTTEAKENLVAAINEAARTGGVDVSGAQVGQTIRVSAVDENGKPTEWEAADIPSGVQPDWNQNDGTQHDYVKNRPFYTGAPVETVLVEESTVSFSYNGGSYMANFPSTFEATVGETYKVSWDGVAYECTSVSVGGLPAIGNLAIIGGGPDTGEPFVMGIQNGDRITIFTTNTSASHTFSISGLAREIVKIDAKYLPFPFKPDGISYLTFSSRNSFSLRIREKGWDGTLEYFASDETWTIWDGTSLLSAAANGGEYVLYLRGTGNTVITTGSGFVLLGSNISCIGNIETLLDYATVESGGHPAMAEGCYQGMFSDCTSLTRAPELPATTLANSCYNFMFSGCTNLIQAPELPATTLASGCYQGMFSDCTSLTRAPELPATTLANSCYYMMFSGCTNLIQISELPATTLASGCYYMMFSDCTSLTRAPELPATILANSCYYRMFEDCTSLTQVSELPATTLANLCYYKMFYGCTSLKLSETKTEEYTQEYRIPLSGDGTGESAALAEMFISTGGTFTGTPEINTTYYLSSDNMIARGNGIANLNGYVKSMIDSAGECIPAPATAEVGQAIVVKAVDENGKPTEWEAADIPSGGGGSTVELDTALTQSGKAADAKAVGDALAGKQNTISDLEAIRNGAAKGTTAMQSVPSTYRTASEQDTIDDGKVDKVTGKGLSSNDYTDAAKAKVDALAPVATSGSYNDLTNKPTIPTALPNPNALTFTGAVTGSYDGSATLEVEIPQGGGGAWHTIGTQKMDGVETAVSFDLNGETIIQIIVTAHWGAALTATKATVSLTLANGETVQFTPQTLNASSYSPKNIFTIFGNSKNCRQMIFSKSEGATYNQVQGSFGVAYGYGYVSEDMVADVIATGITITFEQAPSHDAIVKVEGM